MVRSPASASSHCSHGSPSWSLTVRSLALTALLAAASSGAMAQKGETVKIAWIDPLSGLMAPVGQNQVNSFRFFAEKFSGAGNAAGVKFEVVPFDNKLSPAGPAT